MKKLTDEDIILGLGLVAIIPLLMVGILFIYTQQAQNLIASMVGLLPAILASVLGIGNLLKNKAKSKKVVIGTLCGLLVCLVIVLYLWALAGAM